MLFFVLVAVISVRLALEVTVLCSLRIWAGRTDPAFSLLFNMWRQWDANHYLELAEHGYTTSGQAAFNIAFLPLFPWAIRVVAMVVRNYLAAGLIVSFCSSIVASYFLYHLVREELSETAARGSVLALNVFPTAYFLIAPYTEALFLALTFSSLYLARVGRIRAAAVLGALCTATKVNAIVLWPTLILLAHRRSHGNRWSPRILWLLIVPSGLLLYLGINYELFGDPLHFLAVQREHWFHSFRWPWRAVIDLGTAPFKGAPSPQRVVIFDLGAAFIFVAAISCLWSLARLPFAYSFQGLATVVILLATSWNISLGRYVYSVVPMFFFLGAISQSRVGRVILLTLSLPLLGLLSATFAAGRWAY